MTICYALYLFGIGKDRTVVAKNSSLGFIPANFEIVHIPKKPPANTGMQVLLTPTSVPSMRFGNDHVTQNGGI